MNVRKFSSFSCVAVVLVAFGATVFAQSSLETGGSYDPAPANVDQRGVGAFTFAAATWSDDSLYLLDAGLATVGNFPVGTTDPNGAAAGGGLFYVGSFSDQEVVGFDAAGVEQVRWSASLGGLQGMTYVDGQLAIYQNPTIELRDPATGTVLDTIPGPDSTEGLAWDGTLIWALADDLVGVDPSDGSIVTTLTNPASGCSFGGSGLAFDGTSLVAACDNGDWFVVDPATGSVTDSGNNGLDMFGLAPSGSGVVPPPPEPQSVPTLSGIGLVLAVLALLSVGVMTMRARSGRLSG